MIINIIFSVPKKWRWWALSNFIRWSEFDKTHKFWGRYPASHASILQDMYVTEAVMWLGVRRIHLYDWFKLNRVVSNYTILVDKYQYEDIRMFLEGSVGIPYSTVSAIGIFVQRVIKKLFGKEIANPFGYKTRRRKCTELVAEVLEKWHLVEFPLEDESIGVRYLEDKLREKFHGSI